MLMMFNYLVQKKKLYTSFFSLSPQQKSIFFLKLKPKRNYFFNIIFLQKKKATSFLQTTLNHKKFHSEISDPDFLFFLNKKMKLFNEEKEQFFSSYPEAWDIVQNLNFILPESFNGLFNLLKKDSTSLPQDGTEESRLIVQRYLDLSFVNTIKSSGDFSSSLLQFNFQRFPFSLHELLYNFLFRELFYWNVQNDFFSNKGIFLPLNRLIQSCFNLITEEPLFITEYIKFKEHNITNSVILTTQAKTHALAKLKNHASTEFLMDLLQDLKQNGFVFSKKKENNTNIELHVDYHILQLPISNSYTRLFKSFSLYHTKLRLSQPLNWLFNPVTSTVFGGGNFHFRDNKRPLFKNILPNLKCKVTYSEEYVNDLNLIQKDPFFINLNLLSLELDNFLNIISQDLNIKYSLLLTTINKVDSVSQKQTLVCVKTIRNLINKVNLVVLDLVNLYCILLLCPVNKYGVLKIYNPLFIDKVGRMYMPGTFNIMSSTFFRKCLVEGDTQIRSSKKKVFYDATASILQIYSLLFGDIQIAIFSNLHKDQYDPYLEVRKSWVLSETDITKVGSWIEVTLEREFLKKVIMLTMYGSSGLNILKELRLLYKVKKKNLLQVDPDGLSYTTFWAIKQVKISFSKLFKVHDMIVKNSKISEITILWQKNKSIYCYFKETQWTLDISKLFKEKNIAVSDQNRKRLKLNCTEFKTVDKNKNSRTILPGIIHSLDAAVALNLRLTMKEKYNTDVFAIHDSFCVDECFVVELKLEYKRILFKYVFEKQLKDIIYVDNKVTEIFGKIQTEINLDKHNNIWQEIQQSFSNFCLKKD